MLYESINEQLLSSREINSQNIFKNLLKEEKKNKRLILNTKLKIDKKLIETVDDSKKLEKNCRIQSNEILKNNSNNLKSRNKYYYYNENLNNSNRTSNESKRRKFLTSTTNNNRYYISYNKNKENNRRQKNLTFNSPDLIKTLNKIEEVSPQIYFLINNNNNNINKINNNKSESIKNFSSNSKKTLSFSSSSDKKNKKILSKDKNNNNKIKESSTFIYLSSSKISEVEEIIIKDYKSKSLNKKEIKNFNMTENNNLNSNNSSLKNKEKNINNITKTTSVNSSSNNNNISSFRMSASNFKNSNLSLNLNSKENNYNVLNTFNLKNAIANAELDNSNLKKNKKNKINILTISNSEKKLLIPEYSVQKPLIQKSYLNFNKKKLKNNNEFFITSPNFNKKLNCFNKKSSNQKFQKILDDIISNSEEINKDMNKFILRNNKRSKTYSKNFDLIDIEKKELILMKEVLNDNITTENYFHKLRCETVNYDNKLIKILKNSYQPFIVNIIKNRSKIRNKTLEMKKKNIIQKAKFKIKDYNTIHLLLNEDNKKMNKFKNIIDDNIEMMKFLNKKNYLFQLKNQNNHYIYNSNFYKINITQKIERKK